MNIQFFTLTLLLLYSFLSSGQQINIYKTFGGYRFEKDTVSISSKMVLRTMETNPEAHATFKKAKRNYDFVGVLNFTGGLLILIPVATAIGGGDPEWGLAAGGVGLVLASIPFNSAFKNHALNAIDLYNAGVSARRVKATFSFAGTGGKLVIRF